MVDLELEILLAEEERIEAQQRANEFFALHREAERQVEAAKEKATALRKALDALQGTR